MRLLIYIPYGIRKTSNRCANIYKRNKAKCHHTNIYIKKMGDKTNQSKRKRRTQSKRSDQRNTSTPLTRKSAD